MASKAMAKHRIQEAARRKSRGMATYNKFKKYKFPNCIGVFPECKEYTKDMDIKDRKECQKCPYGGMKNE